MEVLEVQQTDKHFRVYIVGDGFTAKDYHGKQYMVRYWGDEHLTRIISLPFDNPYPLMNEYFAEIVQGDTIKLRIDIPTMLMYDSDLRPEATHPAEDKSLSPKEKANKLIGVFYQYMPFQDTKLTSCAENPKLIVEMEKIAAKQCAVMAAEMLVRYTGSVDGNPPNNQEVDEYCCEYWEEVLIELNKL